MTHTVTLLADHKGYTRPRVMGDEYMVDASIDISSYTANGEVITASSLGLSRINRAMIVEIGGGQTQFSFNLVTGADTKNNLYLEVNKENDSTGVEAALAGSNTELDGTPIIIRAYGLI